jgi:hypothetical protein
MKKITLGLLIIASIFVVSTPITEAKVSVKKKQATAICRDGSYSYSANRKGTCSHHKGVKVWLK